MITPVSLALACAATIALLGACVVVIGRAAFAREQDVDPSPASATSRWHAALWLTTLFLVVFSAKLVLMQNNPVTVPYWDQWVGEAQAVFVPFSEHSLRWRAMFDFHNEHRILFTRLLALGLLEINSQWDPRLESVANAVMHSLTAVLLAAMLWISNGRRRLDLLVLVCAVVFGLQFAWENTLLGFQSAFYFLLLFSLLALWLTTTYRSGTGPWWLGCSCAFCALFALASGVMVAAAIAGVLVLKWASDRREWRGAVVNAGAIALVVAVGIALASPPLAPHEYLKAKTAADLLGAFTRNMAWPWIDHPLMCAVMWLPLGALAAASLIRRLQTTDLERFVAGLGAWVALNAAALAYGRGAGAGLPASRYMDVLSLGFVVNAVALVTVLDRTRAGTAARQVARGVLVGWLLLAVVGVDRLVARATSDLSVMHQYFLTQTSTVRRFMVTGDAAEFKSKQPLVELPYPDPEFLMSVLQRTVIRRILPAAVRAPLHVEPRVNTNNGFVMEGPYAGSIPRDSLARSWWSLAEEGRKGLGRFESQPLACQQGSRLKFEVSGYLGWKGQYLAIRDLRTGRDLAVRPSRLAGDNWTDAIVPCPPGPFEIVAIDEAPDSWFGFREPVEIGWASIVAESLIQKSRASLVVLLAMSVLIFAVRWT